LQFILICIQPLNQNDIFFDGMKSEFNLNKKEIITSK